MKEAGEKVAEFLVNLICEHPAIVGWFVVIWLVATFTCNAIKLTWPVYHEMPKAARFALGFFMPLAINFWHIGKKIGVQEPEAPKP